MTAISFSLTIKNIICTEFSNVIDSSYRIARLKGSNVAKNSQFDVKHFLNLSCIFLKLNAFELN